MNSTLRRRALAVVGLLLLAGLSGCAVTGGGYDDDDVGVSYFGGFYEPFGFGYGDWGPGYDYGGWGPGYFVGPPGWGVGRPMPSYGHPYRSAPPSRPMPSIPSRGRPR